jgi:hypothetical protein
MGIGIGRRQIGIEGGIEKKPVKDDENRKLAA